jgi:hypothetical protein
MPCVGNGMDGVVCTHKDCLCGLKSTSFLSTHKSRKIVIPMLPRVIPKNRIERIFADWESVLYWLKGINSKKIFFLVRDILLRFAQSIFHLGFDIRLLPDLFCTDSTHPGLSFHIYPFADFKRQNPYLALKSKKKRPKNICMTFKMWYLQEKG